MTNLDTPVSSLPSRPLAMEKELTQLEESERFEAIIHDEGMTEVVEPFVYVYNLVFITQKSVSAVVYIEDEETWYRVFKEDRSDAELTDAYDAVREIRDEATLYDRHSLTIEEAVFMEDRPSQEETSGYEEGDSFDCPVCGNIHIVKFEEEEMMKDHPTDVSQLYVNCPEARNDELILEYQARTPS
jgi:predicted RNA-binding Zn-ribbon protein involved in translation (DUF1610 family)